MQNDGKELKGNEGNDAVQKAGVMTSTLHEMEVGDVMGVRGPLGNSWPIDFLVGKNIVIVGGGFAFTTLRSLINYMIDEKNRSRFGKITVIYGARTGPVFSLAELDKLTKEY